MGKSENSEKMAEPELLEYDGMLYSVANGKAILIGPFMGKVGDVVIPDHVAFEDCRYTVVAMQEGAYRGCRDLTSLTLPDSMVRIYDGALNNCDNLTSLTISGGIIKIGTGVACDCSSLTRIKVDPRNPVYHSSGNCIIETESKTLVLGCKNTTIPNDGSVTKIGINAFAGCDGLTSITIPDSVTSIGEYAFSGCDGLTSITIPDSVTSIGEYAFSGCGGLTSITIPGSVTDIGNNAFRGCNGLTSITIPGSVTGIGNNAFRGCNGLTSITIPDSVTSIGSDTFRGCNSLTNIAVEQGNSVYHSAGNCLIETASKTLILGCQNSVIPDNGSVTSIGDYAFRDCYGLTSITIPDGVTSIGMSAFDSCYNLTSITIPDSVTSIKYRAFFYCDALTVFCKAESQPDSWDSDWNSGYRPVVWGYKGN